MLIDDRSEQRNALQNTEHPVPVFDSANRPWGPASPAEALKIWTDFDCEVEGTPRRVRLLRVLGDAPKAARTAREGLQSDASTTVTGNRPSRKAHHEAHCSAADARCRAKDPARQAVDIRLSGEEPHGR